MQSVEYKIERKVKNSKRGKIFFQDDFATLGSPGAIRLALSRIFCFKIYLVFLHCQIET